ncbi:MAG: hypothetical protein LBJ11_10755 [Oscillospiraceae bacterium]|jgi:uncharacterized protein Yka (UPF0111/DUF47 family)|nr:hypothetical protein [Oscillospiraceae bacterium]
MKKSVDYFSVLARQSDFVRLAAERLAETLRNYQFLGLPETLAAIQADRQRSAALCRELTGAAVRDFLPPLERGDLLGLSAGLDGALGAVEQALRQLAAFQTAKIPAAAAGLGEKIAAQAVLLGELTGMLPRLKKNGDGILSLTERISAMTREIGEAVGDALRVLFSRQADPRELLIWSTVYFQLERCGGAGDQLARAAELALMRNL